MLSRLVHVLGRMLDVPVGNPGFDLSLRAAADEESRMRREPRALLRPVVVIGGYRAWSIAPASLASRLCAMTCQDPAMFASLAYPWCTDFPRVATRLCDLVNQRWLSHTPGWTHEVDVVGVSMGGLVARAAAAGLCHPPASPRLNIARLFTLATPHRGAKLAERACPDAAARDMRPGSPFLVRLDLALNGSDGSGYPMVCYTRLRDTWVGATRSSPPGHPVHWVSGQRVLSHVTVALDPRITVDIARRLRGEPPLAGQPCQPPGD